MDSRTIEADCPPEAALIPIACIGGENGWYAFDTLWDIRGFIDILLGGPGHRRGRRDQYALIEGDHLEWWRVERVDAPTLLRLRAEMKMPGEGWLQYELVPAAGWHSSPPDGDFHPKGLLGRAYWYSILPIHHFVFNGTLRLSAESAARWSRVLPPVRCRGNGSATRRNAHASRNARAEAMLYQSDYILRLIEQMGALIRRALELERTGGGEQPYELAEQALGLALDIDPETAHHLSPESLAALLELSNHDDRVLELIAEALEVQADSLQADGELMASESRLCQASAVRALMTGGCRTDLRPGAATPGSKARPSRRPKPHAGCSSPSPRSRSRRRR